MPARLIYINHVTDQELIILLQNDNREAFDMLYRKYWKPLFNSAYKRLENKEAAEEVVQELFINLWIKRNQLEITQSFLAYLQSALKNRVLNYLRHEHTYTKHKKLMALKSTESANLVDEKIAHSDLQKTIEKCLSAMPDKYRTAYLLNRHNQLSVKEIAQYLNTPESTIEKRLINALKLLKDSLKNHTITLIGLLLLLQ